MASVCNRCNAPIEWDEDRSRAICANIGRAIKNKPPPLNADKQSIHSCSGGGGGQSTNNFAQFERKAVEPITMLNATDVITNLSQQIKTFEDVGFKKIDELKLAVDLNTTYIKANTSDFQKRLENLEVQVTTISELVTAMAHANPNLKPHPAST